MNALLQPLKSLLHAKRHGNGAAAWDKIISDAENAIEAAEHDAKFFTVIGQWDNGQVFVESVEAADAYEAMRKVSAALVDNDELAITGAVAGQVTLITPGDDNGMSAYACDLAELGGEHG